MSWSEKYKRSIDCENPKGFSQKAHCQGKRKKMNISELKEPLKFSKFSHKTKHFGKLTHQLDPNLNLKHLVHHASIEYLDRDADGDVDIFDKMNIPDESPGENFEKTSKQLIKKQKGEIEHSKKKIAYYEGTLHHWYKGSRSKEGTPGWVQPDGSPCANEPGETKTPKCFSSARLASLKSKGKKGESIIRSAVRRKREKDKGQQAKSGAAAPTNVSTFAKGKKDPNYVKAEPGIKEAMEINEAKKDKPGKGSGTKDACYHKVKSRYDVWPSAYASGALVKCRKVGASNWGTKSEEVEVDNRNDMDFHDEVLRYCPACKKSEKASECKYGKKYWRMFSHPLSTISDRDYTPNTPHPGNFPESYTHERTKLIPNYVKEENYSNWRSELIISEKWEDKLKNMSPDQIENLKKSNPGAAEKIDSMRKQVTSATPKPIGSGAQLPNTPKTPVVQNKGQNFRDLKTQSSYNNISAARRQGLQNVAAAQAKRAARIASKPSFLKTLSKVKNPKIAVPLAIAGGIYGLLTATKKQQKEGYSNWRSDFGLSEDWQKVNRKDKTDGLSQAAVDTYRRENPGSKLQTAVTEKNPKGKRSERRKSFCRRMKGMKSELTSEKTARDPDSRINKALRRWRCN